MALISSARFPSGGGRDVPDVEAAGALACCTVGNMICGSVVSLNSALPAGNLPTCRM